MTLIFGPKNFQFYLKTWFGYPYREQAVGDLIIAKNKVFFEMGVEESLHMKVYYIAGLCFMFMVCVTDKKFVPEWAKPYVKENKEKNQNESQDPKNDGEGNGRLIKFPRSFKK